MGVEPWSGGRGGAMGWVWSHGVGCSHGVGVGVEPWGRVQPWSGGRGGAMGWVWSHGVGGGAMG